MTRTIWDLYTSDQAVRDPMDFVGRHGPLLELLDSIRSGNCVQIVGPRRIGKSSVLQHLTRLSTLERRIPDVSPNLVVYLNLQGLAEPTEDAFWGMALARIRSRLLQMGAEQGVAEQDTPPLPPGTRKATLWAADAPGDARSRVPYAEARDKLDTLREVGFQRMTVLIDELEVLGQIPGQHDLTQRLRALAADSRWPVTFVTASRHPIAALTQDGRLEASPFYNIFSQTVRLAGFSAEELAELVTLPERLAADGRLAGWDGRLSLLPHRAWIEEVAGDHPFYSTVACRRMIRHLAEPLRAGEPPRALAPADLSGLVRDLEDDLSGQIDASLADRTDAERQLLTTLVHQPRRDVALSDPAARSLLAEGVLIERSGRLLVAAALVARRVPPPPSRALPTPTPRQLAALGALVLASGGALWLGTHLYGPLPLGTAEIPLDGGRLTVRLEYPREVRLEETEEIGIDLTGEPGAGGEVQVVITSEEGGLAFVGEEVDHSFAVPADKLVRDRWSVEARPRPVTGNLDRLSVRARWLPTGAPAEATQRIVVNIEGRALSEVRVILASAATLVLGLLGLVGGNLRSLGAWLLATWRGLGAERR